MEEWFAILLPFVLLMSRVAGFVSVCPIFGWRAAPAVARVGVIMLVTMFFAVVIPPSAPAGVHWVSAVILIVQEATIGLALGLAARLVYSAVQQGALMAARQMGFADAGVFDPTSGERSRPLGTLFEVVFALLFLMAGGHRLLLAVVAGSFKTFPVAEAPNIAALAEGIVRAGSTMLLFALKLAAPMLAGFLILAVLLCILARVLPEMNILLASFPLRVGIGLFLAAASLPLLNSLTGELAKWMCDSLIV